MTGYYYLVATLNEYSLSGDSKQLDYLSTREDVLGNLNSNDRKLLELLLSYWDIQNFLNVISGRTNQYSIIGNYSKEQMAELSTWYSGLVEYAYKTEEQQDHEELEECSVVLSEVFAEVFKSIENSSYAESKDIDISTHIAQRLFECYYSKLEKTGNKFLKSWSEFDRSVKNLSAAFEARKLAMPIEDAIVGEGFVCDSIIENKKEETFGLNEVEWVAEIIKLLSNKDIIKKERGLDLLRWNYLDDLSAFNYFNVDFVLAYMLKIIMIIRWLHLDEKIGREMFDKLVGQITSSNLIKVELQ